MRQRCMRTIGLLSIVILVYCCKSPATLNGTYSSGPNFVGVVYTFDKDSSFTLDGWSCTGSDTGIGKYTVAKDSLILLFDSVQRRFDRSVVFDSTASSGDSCVIKVYCRDEIESLAFAAVFCMVNDGRKFGAVTDIEGNARIKVANADFPLTLECKYFGYRSLRAVINTPANFDLKFQFESDFTYRIPQGTRFAYGLKSISKDGFVLTVEYIDGEGKPRTNEEVYKRKWK